MRKTYQTRQAVQRGSIREFFGNDPSLLVNAYTNLGPVNLTSTALAFSTTGTPVEMPIFMNEFGAAKRGRYYEGTDSADFIGHVAALNTAYVSVGCWYQHYYNLSPTANAYLHLFCKWWDGTDRSFDLLLTGATTSTQFKASFYVATAASNVGDLFASSEANLIPGLYWIVGTFDGTTIKIYLNGRLAGATSVASTTLRSNTVRIASGCDGRATPEFFGKSVIHDAFMFNRALSPIEIKDYYLWSLDMPSKKFFTLNASGSRRRKMEVAVC